MNLVTRAKRPRAARKPAAKTTISSVSRINPTLRRPGKQNFRVRAYDVSPEGCKVELVDRPDLRGHE